MPVRPLPLRAAGWRLAPLAILCSWALMTGCSSPPVQPTPPAGLERADRQALPDLRIWILNASQEMVAVSLRDPSRALERRAVQGLPAGDEIVSMDFRVARGELYAVSRSGRLWKLDTATAQAQAVGPAAGIRLDGTQFEVDFNPTVDRLRLVSNQGQSLRLHPDTGALVAQDPLLHAVDGRAVSIGATAYTYHPKDDKLTSNFVIDLMQAQLMLQGSREGEQPVVSPNTGRLTTVGPLGLPAPLQAASLDISDRGNLAVAALRGTDTALYLIDLGNGRARWVGRLLDGAAIRTLAIEP